jgi:hypothetical protein
MENDPCPNKLCALVWESFDAIVPACKAAGNRLLADPVRTTSMGNALAQVSLFRRSWYKVLTWWAQ